ncbi:MAG TPA: PIN domain-containing protein [Chthoniobacterales bacterium]|nr:PIN domain-containing protein [Chthoniobacterales bacterium]
MIHVDTNLLIASVDPSHKHARHWQPLIASGDAFAASAVAWTEFQSYPISYDRLRALDRLILGGIVPFDRAQAELAGEIFQKTNARRKNRLDSMIAATAILAEAELATVNEADLKSFLPFGLELHRL